MSSAEHKTRVTGTKMDGGWFYAYCSCGWTIGAFRSGGEAEMHADKHANFPESEATNE